VLSGPQEAAFGALGADRPAVSEFTVVAPADGQRALVQFRVDGEGPAGRIGRGATYNLLPEGPQRPTQIVNDAAGRPIAEYEARRISQ
jgi:hypothetical protein